MSDNILDIYVKPIPVKQYTIKGKIVSVEKGKFKIDINDSESSKWVTGTNGWSILIQ